MNVEKNVYDESTIRLLAFSIIECNFSISKFMLSQFSLEEEEEGVSTFLNNIDSQIKSDINNQHDLEYFNNLYKVKDSLDNSVFIRQDISFEDVYFIVEKLIKTFGSSGSSISRLSTFKQLFQHLYIIGLQCFDSTFTKIENLNQLFKSNSLDSIIDNEISNFFKSFYYLYLRSWKLTNYFLSRVKNFNFTYYQTSSSNTIISNEEAEAPTSFERIFFKNDDFSFNSISNTKFDQLFLKLRNEINNNEIYNLVGGNNSETTTTTTNQEQQQNFKTNFYFDMHYLFNVKKGKTILKLLKSIVEQDENSSNSSSSDGKNKLKKINYIGFLNNLRVNENENDFNLFQDLIKLNYFKNRLLLEFVIEKLNLELVKFILSNFKTIKRINEDLLKTIFSLDYQEQLKEKSIERFNKNEEILNYLLSNHKDLVLNSLVTSKFSLFTSAFLDSNLRICKLIMLHLPFYVEIKIKHIKQNILNNNFQILQYFYFIGSVILKSRIKRLINKYKNDDLTLNWLI